jgi:ketosteroid isomerase-like protein
VGTYGDVAAAFSSHRFSEAYPALSDGVRWVAVGGTTTTGREAVIEICETTRRELANTTTEQLRFVVADGGDTVAVDAVTNYTDGSGAVSSVASCDIYEFRDGLVETITSYAVEVEQP